ncbi:MAG: class I SAM-dependent DNA methyltransferase [Bacteroidia bacterium]|nr:class I SAM-dependent DNA methyltransferase [Bacteroidia bacterium]
MANTTKNGTEQKSLESWIWGAACSIRGAKDAPKFKDYILPLIFTKRLCDVFDDELDRIAKEVGSRKKAFALVKLDNDLVRFYLPLTPDNHDDPVWSVIRKLASKIGEQLTTILRDIAKENPTLQGIIDRVDFNATTHGQRDIDDDRLSNLIEKISEKKLGIKDVEPDVIGRSYEYLIRKFAENSGKSAGEFYTPTEVGIIMAKIMDPEPGMEIYDPTCGSGGLLIKNQIVLGEKFAGKGKISPLKLYGQEFTPETWAMAQMNMIVHDMEGEIELGDTMKNPKLIDRNRIKKFDRVVANPMWNQNRDSLPYLGEEFFENDPYDRFSQNPGGNADWAWMQHIYASLKENGRAAVVLDTGAASRGSGNANTNKEKDARKWFVDNDLVEGVIYLPENLFYNTSAPGIIVFIQKDKPAERKDKIFLLNASKVFEKGDPKNFITDEGIKLISSIFTNWKDEEEKLSRIVHKEEIAKNDYNISPSRYIHARETEEYRPIREIIDEINTLEEDAEDVNRQIFSILEKLGI